MKTTTIFTTLVAGLGWLVLSTATLYAADTPSENAALPKACIDGTGPGWKLLGKDDFTNVNAAKDTWVWEKNLAHCTGKPVSVIRSVKQYKNFELVAQWRHLRKAGNSGIFVWSSKEALDKLKKPGLPKVGIEVQVLDLDYKTRYEKGGKRKADWFTCHGDVFPVHQSTMKPFPPISPNGRRSFPSKNLTKGVNQWNHYYIRCINGEIRLWVNGTEVSGGRDCKPCSGYLCLESEGSPVEFKQIRIRELP